MQAISLKARRKAFLFIALLLTLALGAPVITAQTYRYNPEHRRPVDATIHHLQEIAARNTYSAREQKRYDHALTHLSQFAERLHEGYFDKGKLDSAIGDVRTIINNNPMDDKARATLNRDLAELRHLRSDYLYGYRYPY